MAKKEEKMVVDDYIMTKRLGKGGFGEVLLTQKKGCKELYATKKMDLVSAKEIQIKSIINEITYLKKINHPNIIRLIDLKRTPHHCYVIMEFCNGGDLLECLKKYRAIYHRSFSEEIIQYIMRQVVSALNVMHSNKIIHRDLKLENILVIFNSENDKNSLNMMRAITKLSDFGITTTLQASKNNKAFTVIGTKGYMEPQIQKNMEERSLNLKGYDEKADIWSLGVVCITMLLGYNPFHGISSQEILQKVKQGNFALPKNISEEIFSFINAMLQLDPNKRLSTHDLLKHSFLVKNVNQFKQLDARKIASMLGPGGVLNTNPGGNKGPNLHETVWGIFIQIAVPGQKFGGNQLQHGGFMPQPQMQMQPNMNLPYQYNQYKKLDSMPNLQRGYI